MFQYCFRVLEKFAMHVFDLKCSSNLFFRAKYLIKSLSDVRNSEMLYFSHISLYDIRVYVKNT